MKTKIFVSKSLDSGSPLIDFCSENEWELIDRSLIYFEDVPFIVTKPFDVVFISSIRAFDYFLECFKGDPGTVRYAVAGSSTAEHMNVEISQIEFVVENSGSTDISPFQFKEWLGDRKVLFPVSQISNNTYSKVVEDHQKEVVVCYNTLSYSTEIDDCSIYVFTSPSNVQSFLLKNTIPENAKIIAWGKTTENYLLQKSLKPAFILNSSSEKELVEVLSGFLN